MRNYPVLVLSAVDTATQTGGAIYAVQAVAASFVAIFGDVTAAGTLKVQGNNDIPVGSPVTFVPSTAGWSDIPNATSTIASGVGPAIILPTMNFQYIRVVYTRSSGGSTTVVVNASFLGV